MRNSVRLSHRSSKSMRSYTSTRGKDYLFQRPGEFKDLLDEFLLRSHQLKLENSKKIEEKRLKQLEEQKKMNGTSSDFSPSKPKMNFLAFKKLNLRTEETKPEQLEDFEYEEPDWNALINPRFLEDKYRFDPENELSKQSSQKSRK